VVSGNRPVDGFQALQLLTSCVRLLRVLAAARVTMLPRASRRSPCTPVATPRALTQTAGLAALLVVAACTGDVTESRTGGKRPIRFNVASTVMAAPGAVIEGVVTYTARGNVVTLARDSVIIASTPNTGNASLSLSANVNTCVDDAAATGSQCTLTLTLRLTRNAALLDENVQTVLVTPGTDAITVPPVSLFEVATVQLSPTTLAAFEPGDTRTLTATALDRNGATVTERTPVWALVSGGVTISATGMLTAVTPGAARIRATVSGRSTELALTVGQPTVATINVLPFDTLIVVGGTATLRTTVLSSVGQTLTGRPLSFASSNVSVATVNAGGVVTGITAGNTNISVSSTEGRGGATVSATVPLRVELAPQILVDRGSVSLDSLVPGSTSAVANVAVTTTVGKRVAGLRAVVTYAQNVTPWLSASINPAATPATLTLQASSGVLAPGLYEADVVLSSSIDAHRPATVRVSVRVLAARRVALSPRLVDLGAYSSSVTNAPNVDVAVTSPTGVPLVGLAATVQYTSAGTGWLSARFSTPAAAPSSTLQLMPAPFGLPDGSYQARVIVRSTTFGAVPDTVNVTLTVSPSGRFAGQLLNGTNAQALAGAAVTIRRATDNVVVNVVSTGLDGRFLSNSLPAGTYTLTFTNAGFVSTTYFAAVLSGSVSLPLTTLPSTFVAPASSPPGVLSGQVRDATNNFALAGVTLELRAGANNITGAPLLSTTSNANGGYSFTVQPAGAYTVRATRTGYAATSVSAVIVGTSNSAPILFISPGAANVVWRFVLSWDIEPADLDAHLTGPIAASANRFHVFVSSKGSGSSSPFSVLDIDGTQGLGPETITIAQQTAGVYRYYVNNYTAAVSNFPLQEVSLSASNARVDVYLGNILVNRFFVPAQPGLIWTVFEINGTTLTPINTNSDVPPGVRVGPTRGKSTGASSGSAADNFAALFARQLKPIEKR